ncbi:MAG TPA: Flp pilus assembly protein CpaB [Candidatus Baltobacteraceae bacterium]|nr:Flp pilus assembly protein CpaB [Candidatus Baltobacteraceae bacterium]
MTLALSNRNRVVALVALLLAAGAALLIFNWMVSVKRTSAAPPPRKVIVARATIPARTTITAAMLRWASKPAAAVDPDAVDDPHLVIGALSLITIPADSTITASKIGHPEDAGLTVRLKHGLRAMAIAVDRVKDVAAAVHPGDYVDVVALQQQGNGLPPHAATIMRKVLVLAVGSSLETASTGTPPPDAGGVTTVTLAVTAHQADLLMLADNAATLRLALRSPDEPSSSAPTENLSFGSPNGGAPQPAQHAQPAPPAPPPAPVAAPRPIAAAPAHAAPARPASSMWIIEGDKLTGVERAGS